MSSSQRSNSGVRNLRAVFENNDSRDSLSPDRGRSPSGSTGGSSNPEKSAPTLVTRKVRTSFISVEPSGQLLAENSDLSNRLRPFRTTSAQRREITNIEGANDVTTSAVRTPIAEMSEISEALDKSSLVSPQTHNKTVASGSTDAPAAEIQSDYTQEPISVVADDEAAILPADPTDTAPGPALAKSRPSLMKKSATSSKVDPTTTKSSSTGGIKSPTGFVKPKPRSPTRPIRLPAHLTQQTTSSSAKHEAAQDSKSKPRSAAGTHRSSIGGIKSATGFVKPKPRSPTRPIQLPAHLTQHTTSSSAKHESESTDSSAKPSLTRSRDSIVPRSNRTSLAGSTTSSTVVKPPPKSSRLSLARSNNETAPRKVQTKPTTGTLDRMTKPTSASSAKLHENAMELKKSPPRLAKQTPQAQAVVTKPSNARAAPSNGGKSAVTKSPVVAKPAGTVTKKPASAEKKTAVVQPGSAGRAIPSKAVKSPESIVIAEEAASMENAAPTELVAPARDAVSVEKAAPIEEAASTEKTAPVDKAAPVEESAPLGKPAPGEEAASLGKAPSVEKAAPVENAAPVEKSTPFETSSATTNSLIQNDSSAERAIPSEETAPTARAETAPTTKVDPATQASVKSSQRAVEAIEPTTDVPPLGAGEDKSTATQPTGNGNDEQNAVAQWNAASLPHTPEMQRAVGITKHPNMAAQGPRSMMETPKLQGAVIH